MENRQALIPSQPSRATVLLVTACAAIPNLAISMTLPIVPVMSAAFGTRASLTTAPMTVYMCGLALGMALIGPWSDRVGRRTPLIAGLNLFLLGSLISAMANGLTVVLVGRFIQSLGGAAVFVTGRAVIGDLSDKAHAAKSLSAMIVVVGIEPVAGPTMGSVFSHIGGWPLVFAAQAVLAAFLLIFSEPAFTEHRVNRAAVVAPLRTPWRRYLDLARNRKFMGLFSVSSFSVFGHSAYLASVPLVTAHAYGLNDTAFCLIAAIIGFAIPVGGLLNRILLRKCAPLAIIIAAVPWLACLALAHALLSVTLLGGLWGWVGLTFFSTVTMSVVYANALACALALVPGQAGSAAAMLGAGSFATGTLASLAVGAFYDRTARIPCELAALGLLITGICISVSFHTGAKNLLQERGPSGNSSTPT